MKGLYFKDEIPKTSTYVDFTKDDPENPKIKIKIQRNDDLVK